MQNHRNIVYKQRILHCHVCHVCLPEAIRAGNRGNRKSEHPLVLVLGRWRFPFDRIILFMLGINGFLWGNIYKNIRANLIYYHLCLYLWVGFHVGNPLVKNQPVGKGHLCSGCCRGWVNELPSLPGWKCSGRAWSAVGHSQQRLPHISLSFWRDQYIYIYPHDLQQFMFSN